MRIVHKIFISEKDGRGQMKISINPSILMTLPIGYEIDGSHPSFLKNLIQSDIKSFSTSTFLSSRLFRFQLFSPRQRFIANELKEFMSSDKD